MISKWIHKGKLYEEPAEITNRCWGSFTYKGDTVYLRTGDCISLLDKDGKSFCIVEMGYERNVIYEDRDE